MYGTLLQFSIVVHIKTHLLCMFVLQTLMLPSLDPDSAFSPSAVSAIAVTLSECPSIVCSSCPARKSHSLLGREGRWQRSVSMYIPNTLYTSHIHTMSYSHAQYTMNIVNSVLRCRRVSVVDCLLLTLGLEQTSSRQCMKETETQEKGN